MKKKYTVPNSGREDRDVRSKECQATCICHGKSLVRYNAKSNVTVADGRTHRKLYHEGTTKRAPTTRTPDVPGSSRDGGNSRGGNVTRRQRTIADRPMGPVIVAMRKNRETIHRRVKSDALRLWSMLGNPVFDSQCARKADSAKMPYWLRKEDDDVRWTPIFCKAT